MKLIDCLGTPSASTSPLSQCIYNLYNSVRMIQCNQNLVWPSEDKNEDLHDQMIKMKHN